MRAAVYYSNSDLRIEDVFKPKIGPGELLVRVEASGICGSDVMEWYRRDKVPLVLGHEISGVIEEVGSGLDYREGLKVVCSHHVPCGKCHYCLNAHPTACDTLRRTNFDPGGFCEFVRLAPKNVEKGVWAIPQGLSFEEATFTEPLACVLRGQRQAGGVKGKCVLVIGSGIAGILHIHLAKALGAASIIAVDVVEYRLKAAKKFGADVSVNAKEYAPDVVRSINQGRLADLVIVSTGSGAAINTALESVERGGTVLFFAPTDTGAKVPFSFNELFWRTEITLTSSYAASPEEYKEALDLIASRKLNILDMITHRFKLAEIGAGFNLVAEAKDSLKVIIYPQK